MTKPDRQFEYEARIRDDSEDPKVVVLGPLSLAGDVFVLNYKSSDDFTNYDQIVVVSKSLNNEEETVLEGNF